MEMLSKRDPFEKAREQKAEKALSKSPVAAQVMEEKAEDFRPMLQGLGISHENLAMNDMGKIQLKSRLQEKFGEEYHKHPMAIAAMDAFDKGLKANPDQSRMSTNEMLANAQRTLAALFGGKA